MFTAGKEREKESTMAQAAPLSLHAAESAQVALESPHLSGSHNPMDSFGFLFALLQPKNYKPEPTPRHQEKFVLRFKAMQKTHLDSGI